MTNDGMIGVDMVHVLYGFSFSLLGVSEGLAW